MALKATVHPILAKPMATIQVFDVTTIKIDLIIILNRQLLNETNQKKQKKT